MSTQVLHKEEEDGELQGSESPATGLRPGPKKRRITRRVIFTLRIKKKDRIKRFSLILSLTVGKLKDRQTRPALRKAGPQPAEPLMFKAPSDSFAPPPPGEDSTAGISFEAAITKSEDPPTTYEPPYVSVNMSTETDED
jgi:hypothetical protein